MSKEHNSIGMSAVQHTGEDVIRKGIFILKLILLSKESVNLTWGNSQKKWHLLLRVGWANDEQEKGPHHTAEGQTCHPALECQALEEPWHPLQSSSQCNPKEALISGTRSPPTRQVQRELLISPSTGQEYRDYSKTRCAFISTDFVSPFPCCPVGP